MKQASVFMNGDEICEDLLLYQLSEKTKRDYSKHSLSSILTIGIEYLICDYYRLWDANNPYVIQDDNTHALYPSQFARDIVKRVWQTLSTHNAI